MSVASGLPKKQLTATEKSAGYMSAKDKKSLNTLIKQMAGVLKTLANIPSDNIIRLSEDIKIDDEVCGKLSLKGDIVTMNLNLSCKFNTNSYKKLFTLPEAYIPTKPLSFIIPVIVDGVSDIEVINIGTDGSVLCKVPKSVNNTPTGLINTSISYII